jgi:molybdenum-dependent DNA-binding transcriptional regulator ModE
VWKAKGANFAAILVRLDLDHIDLSPAVRTFQMLVAISETGSLTKAAERLGLSQPAVSSQIKRIQTMVGGNLFTKTVNATTATQLGKLVLHQARRILEANDQMLRIGGAAHLPQPIRLGLSAGILSAPPATHQSPSLRTLESGDGTEHGLAQRDLVTLFQNAGHDEPVVPPRS